MAEVVQRGTMSLWLRLLGISLIPLSIQGFFPGTGSALGILAPLPLAYGMCRRNIPEGSAAVALVAIITSIVQGVGPGVYFLVETLPLCIGITWAVRRTEPPHIGVLRGVGLVVVTVLLALIVYSTVAGKGPADLYQESVDHMSTLMGSMSGIEELPVEQRAQFEWLLDIWKRLFVGIWMGTMVILFILFTALIRSWLAAAGLMAVEGVPFLSRWSIPFFPFVWIFVGLSLLILVGQGGVRDAGINAMIPLGTLYGVQGIAVLGHLYTRWSVPPFFRVLVLIFMAMMFPMVLLVGMALAGLFDTWFDLRRRFPHKGETPPLS